MVYNNFIYLDNNISLIGCEYLYNCFPYFTKLNSLILSDNDIDSKCIIQLCNNIHYISKLCVLNLNCIYIKLSKSN